MKIDLCSIGIHDWSGWRHFCIQYGNGLLIKYCRNCGETRVKSEREK